MKNRRLNIAAALSFGVLVIASPGYCMDSANTASNCIDEIEIISVKDDVQFVTDDRIADCGCPKPFAMPSSVRVNTETGAAAGLDCDPCKKPEIPSPCCDNEVMDFVEVSPACPCPVVIDPCDPCDPCDVSPACPCPVVKDPCNSCNPCAEPVADPCPVPKCNTNQLGPDCAVSPGYVKGSDKEIQVYAYPKNVYGVPSIFASESTAMGLGGATVAGTSDSKGIMVSENEPIGGNVITGAAAGLPTINKKGCDLDLSGNVNSTAPKGCPLTIHSNSSMQVVEKSFDKIDLVKTTGAATPLTNSFKDISPSYWAANDINRLAAAQVVAGYPDHTFKPDRYVTRAEFTSLVVSGLNYQGEPYYDKAIFSDVPQSHWANKVIDKGVNGGLVAGYPDGRFKPNANVTRAEALVTMAKSLSPCDMDDCKAEQILSKYSDASSIPAWSKVPVAKAIQAGLLNTCPETNTLRANDEATRAEIVAMLATARVAIGIDAAPIACGCAETGAAAYVETDEIMQVPTLKVKFDDSISARENQAGESFRARSTECIKIDGKLYPEGSLVRGKIVEVVRPTKDSQGALKVVFTEIKNEDMSSPLPQEVLAVQVLENHKPNVVSRIAKTPFTWAGSIIGNTARTLGGALVVAGNGAEAASGNFGTGMGELFQGKLGSAFKSYGQSAVALVKAPIDVTRTGLSGVAGLVDITTDEIAFVIASDGTKISQINPNEVVQVAFGVCDK
ncbi:MAG: S-layer homology domain-containing protein [Candidatus Gastranaerophilales bacterium]|nr:S-layer homology domain-containing protein [Candidatus Gastranaerophilales bacterium]